MRRSCHLNIGFGGIQTLGWQGGAVDLFNMTIEQVFAVRNNHVRFIDCVWLGSGLLMLSGSLAFQHLSNVLIALTAMIVVGGLARFSGGDVAVLLGGDVASSLVIELALPLLGLWLLKAERPAVRTSHRALPLEQVN